MEETITVKRLAYEGAGVGTRNDGKTVFVSGGCPGDTVTVHVDEEHPTFVKSHVASILEASPHRVSPPCPFYHTCGGCPWQILSYDEQLVWKRRAVVDAFTRIGTIPDAENLVKQCLPSKKQWGYRNKVEWAIKTENDRLSLGFHRAESNEITTVSRCLLLPKGHEDVPRALNGALRFVGKPEHGLTSLSYRVSSRTQSQEIALWGTPGSLPRKAYADILGSAVKTTSLTRVLTKKRKNRQVISQVEVLAGKGYWSERLANFNFKLSSPSFFQVNTEGAEALIKLVVDALSLDGNELLCDLYCGAGTFTLPLANHSSQLVAVEEMGSAVRDLRRNLEENMLDADVRSGDVAYALKEIKHADALVIDPPRSGISREALADIMTLRADRIVMVSCNPATGARDISRLIESGYTVLQTTPVDLFPQTYHVESVTLLQRNFDS